MLNEILRLIFRPPFYLHLFRRAEVGNHNTVLPAGRTVFWIPTFLDAPWHDPDSCRDVTLLSKNMHSKVLPNGLSMIVIISNECERFCVATLIQIKRSVLLIQRPGAVNPSVRHVSVHQADVSVPSSLCKIDSGDL